MDNTSKFNPKAGIINVPFERQVVEWVDNVVLLARMNDSKDFVQREKDWDTINYIYKGWRILFPEDVRDFEQHIKIIQKTSKNKAIVKEGEAMIQHVLEVPRQLYLMIMTIFPGQKWDKKFVHNFAKHFPQFKGHE